MNIDAIELFHLALPLRRPLPTPLGSFEVLETVLVGMHGDGAVGWGEASPGNAPLIGAEWAAGAMAVLRDWIAPAVVGKSFSSGDDLSKCLGLIHGNQHAKTGVDVAWWDLNARLQNRPLHEILGGKKTNIVEVGPTFDRMDSIDALYTAVSEAVAAGFSRAKFKFRPGWDVSMVDFVRKEFPTLTIHIDCEGGLGLEHMDMLYRLEDFSLAMIEQPLPVDDLVGHAMVQDALHTPICLDESITTVGQADMALELNSCKFVNLKPGRVGGLTPAVAIHDLCHEHCVPCWVGATPQSAVGGRIGFALAAKDNCTYPSDFFPSDRILAEDIAEPLLPVRNDVDDRQCVRLGSAPGIGIEPERTLLERFAIGRAKVAPAG